MMSRGPERKEGAAQPLLLTLRPFPMLHPTCLQPAWPRRSARAPPRPPPLPRFSPVTILAVASILVGVVLLFDPGLLPTANSVAMTLGFCGILAGFITLIWRLRSGDDDDDWDPDDGAVV